MSRTELMRGGKLAFALLLLVVFIYIVFSPALDASFTNWDDPEYLLDNPAVRGLSFRNLAEIFSHHLSGRYHGLTQLTYALEYHFFGLEPRIYHFDNLFLHIINSLLVFVFIRALVHDTRAAFLTALLFGIHPLQVEAVAWVTGRKDVLYAFFYLITLLCYVYGISREKNKRRYYYLTLFFFCLSIFSKITAVTLPLILLLVDYWFTGKVDKKAVKEKLPFFMIAAGMGLITWSFARSSASFPASKIYSVWDRFLFSGLALVVYAFKSLFPIRLSGFYGLPPAHDVRLLLFLLILFFIPFALRKILRKDKLAFFSCAFFILTIWPYLHFLEINDSIVYDRFAYVSLIGVFLLVVKYFLAYLKRGDHPARLRKIFAYSVLAAYVAFLSLLSFRQCFVWRNSETFWNDVIKKCPKAAVAYHNLGLHYLSEGRYAWALDNLNIAIQLEPAYTEAYYNKGIVLGRLGDYPQAITAYSEALKWNPRFTNVYVNRGTMYFIQKEYSAAIRDYDQAIAIEPNHAIAHLNRGMYHYYFENYSQALLDIEQALAFDPQIPSAVEIKTEIKNKLLTKPQD
ncbi:MAG: tetratricopeptide repeat protein [Candidatus Omnitrophota bacterium]